MLENVKVLISTHTSGPLQHSLGNNSASIGLFQGTIGLEVCESVFIEGKTQYVPRY